MSLIVVKGIIVVIAICSALGAIYISKTNDSAVEQAAEFVIKEETGMDVDFSPDLGLPRQ